MTTQFINPDILQRAIRRAARAKRIPVTIVGPSTRTGYTIVEFQNGQTMEVFNSALPSVENTHAYMVFDPIRGMFVISGFNSSQFPEGGTFTTPQHGLTHQYNQVDPVWVMADQYMPLLVLPDGTGTFVVMIYGGVVFAGGSYGLVTNQTLDMASHLPAGLARYALIQADGAGAITVVDGSTVASKSLLTIDDIPLPTTGNVPLCAVALYAGQEKLTRDRRAGKINDFVDLRNSFYSFAADTALAVEWADILNVPTEFTPDTDVTDLLYPRKWLKNTAPTINDDTTAGYSKSDIWVEQANSNIYICQNNAAGAADWLLVPAGAGDVVFAVDGVLAALTNVPGAYIITKDTTIDLWYIYCKTLGSASNTIIDVNKNGTTIFTTQGNRPTLAWNDADGWAVSGTPEVVDFVAGDVITIDIDGVATGAADLAVAGSVSSSGGGGASGFSLTVEEADGAPSVADVGKIVVKGGSVVDNTGGEVEVAAGLLQYGIANGTTDITTVSTSFVDMTDMSVTITTLASTVEIQFCAGVGNSGNGNINIYQLMVDGGAVVMVSSRVATATVGSPVSLSWILDVAAGSHTFKVQWKVNAGTGHNLVATGQQNRTLIVKEYAKAS